MSEEPELRAWTVGLVYGWVAEGAVLDAGCGIGLMLEDLSRLYDAVGVDIAADYVGFCRERGLDAQVGNLERLPFPHDCFDAAVCCDVLEHVQRPAKVLRELKRVVKKGGVIVVRVPDGEATGVGADSGFGFPVHLQSWDEDELRAFLGGEWLGSQLMGIERTAGILV